MNKKWYKKIKETNNYKAYVGPEHLYDVMGYLQYMLLLQLGMDDKSNVLDIGCGSLRAGQWIIPNCNRYTGVEPHKWLYEEKKDSFIVVKNKPLFHNTIKEVTGEFDYILIHSVFSHAPLSMIEDYLKKIKPLLEKDGKVALTFVPGVDDYPGEEWMYPGHVYYRFSTLVGLFKKYDYSYKRMEWPHTTQKWVILEHSK